MIFGDKPDIILTKINYFIAHLQMVREVAIEHHFPPLIFNIVYIPIYLIINLLNCMREAITFWIVILVLAIAYVFIIGGMFSLFFIGWRGFKIYNKRHW